MTRSEALAVATDVEREGILASFVEEAKALAGFYHPNVANIIDRGVSSGAPYVILEYRVGADLKECAWARPTSLFELRQAVPEACAGLAALHNAGLVHRDTKPANIWLRLPLAGGERFDAKTHRGPAMAPPLATVVIDFGMVRAVRVAPDAGGRFVAGTGGYIGDRLLAGRAPHPPRQPARRTIAGRVRLEDLAGLHRQGDLRCRRHHRSPCAATSRRPVLGAPRGTPHRVGCAGMGALVRRGDPGQSCVLRPSGGRRPPGPHGVGDRGVSRAVS